MILITKTFKKNLEKIKSVSLQQIFWEVEKHQNGLQNFIEIWNIKKRIVLKWYLLSKKVRILVLFQEKRGNYLPFYVVKKETKFWHNIRKESLKELESTLDKIFLDLQNGEYEIF